MEKTSLGEAECLEKLGKNYYLLTAQASRFFNSPIFIEQSQLGHLWYPTTHCVGLV